MGMFNGVRFVGINGASVLWSHQIRINSEGIGSATSSITVWVVVGSNIITCVQSRSHRVLVTFKGVILRTEVVIDKVGIAVVVTSWSSFQLLVRIVARQLTEVTGCITVTASIAYINFVDELVAEKWCLPVDVGITKFSSS